MTFAKFLTIMAASMLAIVSCGPAQKTAKTTGSSYSFPSVQQKGKVAIVAHRGFWNCAAAGFAQNSIASLREAQNHGFWGSECDLHLTSDNVILVHHDQKIGTRDIQKNTYESFSEDHLKNGEPIPTFPEYLEQAKQSERTMLIIEIKPQYAPEREDKLVELVLAELRKQDMYRPDRVGFISFSYHVCELIKDQCPEFINQYLNGEKSPEELAAAGINGFDYERGVVFADSTIIARAHNRGMSTNVWTINKRKDMSRLVRFGIDAITTNEPLLLRELLDIKEFRKE